MRVESNHFGTFNWSGEIYYTVRKYKYYKQDYICFIWHLPSIFVPPKINRTFSYFLASYAVSFLSKKLLNFLLYFHGKKLDAGSNNKISKKHVVLSTIIINLDPYNFGSPQTWVKKYQFPQPILSKLKKQRAGWWWRCKFALPRGRRLIRRATRQFGSNK